MLLLQKKKHGIQFYTVWFAKEPMKKNGIIAYREYMGEDQGQQGTKFDTLISDLTETEEEIKLHFSKNCRYYVNRAARENIDVKMFSGKASKFNEKFKKARFSSKNPIAKTTFL